MKYLINIHIQSISDVITNSSSELYLVNTANGNLSGDIDTIIDYIKMTCDNFYITNACDWEAIDEQITKEFYEGRSWKELSEAERNEKMYKMQQYEYEHLVETSSGMGGDLDIISVVEQYVSYKQSFENQHNSNLKEFEKNNILSFSKWFDRTYLLKDGKSLSDVDLKNIDKLLIIDIDYNRRASIDFLKKNFNARQILS